MICLYPPLYFEVHKCPRCKHEGLIHTISLMVKACVPKYNGGYIHTIYHSLKVYLSFFQKKKK